MNQAAERLLSEWAHYDDCNAQSDRAEHDAANPICAKRQRSMRADMTEALAAERRATVERIREAVLAWDGKVEAWAYLDAILDTEAQR